MSELPAHILQIWDAVRAIPRGRVASYGDVARMAGLPGRARLVGHALRGLPEDSDVPWHRVINASGRIAFPVGSEAWQRQRDRLLAEGVLAGRGRIPEQARYRDDYLDRVLWGPGQGD